MKLTYELFDPNPHTNPAVREHLTASQVLSGWSQAGGMKPMTPADMQEFPLSLLAFDERDFARIPVGHAALTAYDGNGNGIMGAHIISPHMRGRGAGLAVLDELFGRIADEYPDIQSLVAHTNPHSRPLHEQLGGVFLGMREPLADNGCNFTMDLMPALQRKWDMAPALGASGLAAVSDTLNI